MGHCHVPTKLQCVSGPWQVIPGVQDLLGHTVVFLSPAVHGGWFLEARKPSQRSPFDLSPLSEWEKVAVVASCQRWQETSQHKQALAERCGPPCRAGQIRDSL